MKKLLKRIGLGWPDFLSHTTSREEYEKRIEKEKKERKLVYARLKALEAEYNIPPRRGERGHLANGNG